jgi:hypothetical protein
MGFELCLPAVGRNFELKFYVRRFLLFIEKIGDSRVSHFILEASEGLEYGADQFSG